MTQRRNQPGQSRTYYVKQKGGSQDPCFFDEACFEHYLNRLFNILLAFRLQLHTYVLLPDEVHLLVSPFSTAGLVRLLDILNRDYGIYFRNRTGSSCSLQGHQPLILPLEQSLHVLEYQKKIELLPVREQLVKMPGEYPWSGYHINAFGGHKRPIVMHHQYRSYCFESARPYQRYRDFVASTSSIGSFHPGPEGLSGYNELVSGW